MPVYSFYGFYLKGCARIQRRAPLEKMALPLYTNICTALKGGISQTWLKELPLELQVHLMTFLDVESLECFITILDIDLAGIVQDVLENGVETKHERRTVTLRQFDNGANNSIINIVYVDGTCISELNRTITLHKPSRSINHIIITYFDNSGEYEIQDSTFLGEFIRSMNQRTSILIKDSIYVGLKRLEFDVSRISFKNVRTLEFEDCTAQEKSLMRCTDIDKIRLWNCSVFMEDSIDYDCRSINDLIVNKKRKLSLENRIINIPRVEIGTLSEANGITFNGKHLTFSMCDCDDSRSQIVGLYAPRLHSLKIKISGSLPKINDIFVPMLKKVEIDQYEMPDHIYEFSASEYSMLDSIEKLTIYSRTDLLFRANLSNLRELYTNVSESHPDIELSFPFLRCLQLILFKTEIPVIRADNLECFTIECFNSEFEANTLTRSFKLYPKLTRFSFINVDLGEFDITDALRSIADRLVFLQICKVDCLSHFNNNGVPLSLPNLASLMIGDKESNDFNLTIHAPKLSYLRIMMGKHEPNLDVHDFTMLSKLEVYATDVSIHLKNVPNLKRFVCLHRLKLLEADDLLALELLEYSETPGTGQVVQVKKMNADVKRNVFRMFAMKPRWREQLRFYDSDHHTF
jgi:hypothetical protein